MVNIVTGGAEAGGFRCLWQHCARAADTQTNKQTNMADATTAALRLALLTLPAYDTSSSAC